MNTLSVRYLFPEDPDALSLFESLNELQRGHPAESLRPV